MRSKLPPYPAGGSWYEWARQLVDYLEHDSKIEDKVRSEIVQLAWQDEDQRAADDGVMMFDPVSGVPVYAHADAWWSLVSTSPAGETNIEGSVNTAGSITVTSDDPSFRLHETDTDTVARAVLFEGSLYIQSGAEGAGSTTSSGVINFSGLNSVDVSQFRVRKEGAYRDVVLMDANNTGVLKVTGGTGIQGIRGAFGPGLLPITNHGLRAKAPDGGFSLVTYMSEAEGGGGVSAYIHNNGRVRFYQLPTFTTGGAANVYSDASGLLAFSTSSEEYKDDFQNIENIYDKLSTLNPIKFHSIVDECYFYGFTAENVGEAMPEAFYNRNYDVRAITALNTAVLQDMDARLRELENGNSGLS